MLDSSPTFMASVAVTIPFLPCRSVGGSLMVLSHLIFVGHFLAMVLRFGPARTGAALFSPRLTTELVHGK